MISVNEEGRCDI